MLQKNISISISRAVISGFFLLISSIVFAQQPKRVVVLSDSLPTFRGVQVMVDLVGPIQRAVSGYGQYEAAVKANFKGKYFPVIEVGYGMADHSSDAVTNNSYKSNGVYGRVGMDLNVLKNKDDDYRFYVGARYAYTNYQFDVANEAIKDPVWKDDAHVLVENNKASQHWAELVAGVDAKIWGALHLGWSLRYKRRLTHKDSEIGKSWYVPGYGLAGDTRLGATFQVIIEL